MSLGPKTRSLEFRVVVVFCGGVGIVTILVEIRTLITTVLHILYHAQLCVCVADHRHGVRQSM